MKAAFGVRFVFFTAFVDVLAMPLYAAFAGGKQHKDSTWFQRYNPLTC
jgi:hypothetical protein